MKLPNPRHRRELDKLLAAHCDESLGESGKERLAALLESDIEARRYYLHYLDLHLELNRRVKHEGLIVLPRPAQRVPSPWQSWPVRAVAAILIAGIGVALWFHSRLPESSSSITRDSTWPAPDATAIAYIARADHVSWNRSVSPPKVSDLLSAGEVELNAGTLRIDFFSGAALTVRAPAHFRLDGVDSVYVKNGQLAVDVSGHESHFKVQTPSAVIVDVGTAFAVNVLDHHTEIHVIDGEVAASLLGEQGTTLRECSLTEGESLDINSKTGEIRELVAADTAFIEPISAAPIPLPITPQYVAAVKALSPLGYWRFEQFDRKQVRNEMSEKHGARLTGRLDLEGDEQNRVVVFTAASEQRGILIEDGFRCIHENGEYSIELWMNPANHDWSGLAALIRADEFVRPPLNPTAPGRKSGFLPPAPRIMALECMPDRESKCRLVHEPRAIRFFHRWPAEDFRHGATHVFSRGQYFPGRWHHIVAVREPERLCLYHNGKLQSRVNVAPNQDGDTYQLMLGRYARASSDRKAFSGPFSGRLDEVALYDHALSESDIQEHYRLVVER